MRDDFKLYHVDMNEFPAHTAELDRQVVVCNGYQRPRFVDTGRKVSGYLGIDEWGNYWKKPTKNWLVAGTLDAAKYYSIKVVPSDTEQAYLTGILVGPPTFPAIPVTPTQALSGIQWNIPAHDQWETHECGTATSDGTAGVQDTSKAWTVDEWAGLYVWNATTGQRVIITSNTADAITATDFVITTGEYFAIQKKTVKRRLIYAAEMDSPDGLLAATFHYQGAVDGAEAATYNLTEFVTSQISPADDIIEPPYGAVTHEAGGRVYIGGGIKDEYGTAYVDVSVEDIQATSDSNEDIDVSIVSALREAVAAKLETDELRFTAQTVGTDGNEISVKMQNTGADALSVAVSTNAITVTLKTDEGMKANATWGQINEARVHVEYDEAGIEGNSKILSFGYQETPGAGMYAVIDGDILRVYLGNIAGEASFDDAKNTRELIVAAINDLSAGFTATVAGVAGSIGTVGQVNLREGSNPGISSTAAEVKAEMDSTGAAVALVATEVRVAGVVPALDETNLAGGEDARVAAVGEEDEQYGRFMRYTLGSALADLANVVPGSVVTVTNSDDSENNVAEVIITRVDPDMRWFEIRNDSGVAADGNESMTIAITHNVVLGTDTRFAEAMKGGTILFANDSERFTIAGVDSVNQRLYLAVKYTGVAVSEAVAFEIRTFNELYWSDNANPHTFRSANYARFPENIVALTTYQETILVFCERNIYTYSIENPAAVPQRITTAQVKITAPWSIAVSPSYGVLFWDGNGFSLTDGIRVVSVTKDKCQWLMEGVHRDMEWNIRALWDNMNQRWLAVFPYGGDATNNYGLHIEGSDRRVYGIQMVDVNAIWIAQGEDDEPVVRHGTTSRHTGTTGGVVFDHIPEAVTDALPSDSGFIATVTNHDRDTNTITVHSDAEITALPGTPVLGWPQGVETAYYKNFIFSSITEDDTAESPYVYDLIYSDDWDIDSIGDGDYLFFGGFAVDYGIKWTNFNSPHIRHNVRRIEIDVEPFSGFVIIDHYANNNEDTPIYSSTHIVTGEHKILSTPKMGGHYTYGFRVRAVAASRLRIDNITILFDPVI
jgi:hypothetical protein